MPILKIEGVPPLDGEYPADITTFKNSELHIIKLLTSEGGGTGVRAGEIGEAFAAGDNDLIVALALIVLQRAEKGTVAQLKDLVWDAEVGAITFDLTEEEMADGDALPPVSEPSESGGPDSENSSSGTPSANGSESPVSLPSPTGIPPLGTDRSGVPSDPVTSAS